MVQPAGQSCYEFRCAQQGYAFQSAAERKCVECSSSMRDGAHPVSGLCIKCDIGKIFNSETGACDDADAYSKPDMQYGKGRTKDNTKLAAQCWTIVAPEEYTVCVRGGGAAASGAASGSSSARAARMPVRR